MIPFSSSPSSSLRLKGFHTSYEEHCVYRGVLRTVSNIYDEVFFVKTVNGYKLKLFLQKKFPLDGQGSEYAFEYYVIESNFAVVDIKNQKENWALETVQLQEV